MRFSVEEAASHRVVLQQTLVRGVFWGGNRLNMFEWKEIARLCVPSSLGAFLHLVRVLMCLLLKKSYS
jgi:hypothetical protein